MPGSCWSIVEVQLFWLTHMSRPHLLHFRLQAERLPLHMIQPDASLLPPHEKQTGWRPVTGNSSHVHAQPARSSWCLTTASIFICDVETQVFCQEKRVTTAETGCDKSVNYHMHLCLVRPGKKHSSGAPACISKKRSFVIKCHRNVCFCFLTPDLTATLALFPPHHLSSPPHLLRPPLFCPPSLNASVYIRLLLLSVSACISHH